MAAKERRDHKDFFMGDVHKIELIHGDALALLPGLPDNSFAAVVTDPPYSSGGAFRSDRAQATTSKHILTGSGRKKSYPDFAGDSRDPRSMLRWMTMWLQDCLRVTEPGGALLMFCDWRQLPLFSDAIQCGGWVWRGIVPWDKTRGTRPQKGWFRAQCEYVLTASKGTMGPEQSRSGPCLDGFFSQNVMSAEKLHSAGKPVKLMSELLRVVRPGGAVLDPFAGSATTLLAARDLGLSATGFEREREIVKIGRTRLGL